MTPAARLLPLLVLCVGLALRPGPGRSAPAPARGKHFTNSVGIKLVRIPAGRFMMGSPASEFGRDSDEGPLHEVEISRSFFLGVYTVTQDQYRKVTGKNPSHFSPGGGGQAAVHGLNTGDFPVERVSWNDAVAFCKELSARPGERAAGRVYRLPSEAEWEYACRAGTKTPFHYGKSLSSRQANFNGNFPYGGAARGPHLNRPCRVGSYKPNKWGLYDMHGNVWQWCADIYYPRYYEGSPRRDPAGPKAGTSRVIRGGSWTHHARPCRAAYRVGFSPTGTGSYIGFRVACDVGGRR
jgi:formylglycine-generating enzyme required for sulfatase activity